MGRGADDVPAGGGAGGTPRRTPEELLAAYIEKHELDRHEVAIAEDASVLVVVATISALSADSENGDLLNHVLAKRGLEDVFFDEAHCLWDLSTAAYSESLANYGHWFDRMCVRLRQFGYRRPRVAGFTSTLPPPCKRSVAIALRMSADAACIRCTIDRPELHFVRLLEPQTHGVSETAWIQAVLNRLVTAAPSWALAGSIIVYCSTTRVARSAHYTVQMLRPGGVGGMRPNALYLGVHRMSTRERADGMARFRADAHAVLFTNEAMSTGSGKAGTSMVVHCALPAGPIELAQRSGRPTADPTTWTRRGVVPGSPAIAAPTSTMSMSAPSGCSTNKRMFPVADMSIGTSGDPPGMKRLACRHLWYGNHLFPSTGLNPPVLVPRGLHYLTLYFRPVAVPFSAI